jgi:hypothetical protein
LHTKPALERQVHRFLRYANWSLLAAAAILLLISLIYLLFTTIFGEWNHNATLYWLVYSKDADNTVFGGSFWIIFWLGIAFLVIGTLSRFLAPIERFTRIGANSAFLLLFVGLLLYGGMWLRFLQFGPFTTWTHLETTNMDNRVYHLLHFTYDATEAHFYRLYECDRFDLFCAQLYSAWPLGNSKSGDNTIKLVSDPTASTISMQVYGEIVYTRHLE